MAKYYKISEEELLKRKKATESQRKKAIYLCKMLSGQTNAEVGRTFRITLQAVTNAVRCIEKKMAEDKRLNMEMTLITKEINKQNVLTPKRTTPKQNRQGKCLLRSES